MKNCHCSEFTIGEKVFIPVSDHLCKLKLRFVVGFLNLEGACWIVTATQCNFDQVDIQSVLSLPSEVLARLQQVDTLDNAEKAVLQQKADLNIQLFPANQLLKIEDIGEYVSAF